MKPKEVSRKGTLFCGGCFSWGYIPSSFDERKHFGKCPSCGLPMFLEPGNIPEEGFYPKKRQVCVSEFLPAR